MINIAICDDDKDFSEILEQKIEKCIKENYRLKCSITCIDSQDELERLIVQGRLDIAFIDIMLGDSNTMDWSIQALNGCKAKLIFMTSFPQCAYNISESSCCYFLIKSRLDDDKLNKAIYRALEQMSESEAGCLVVKKGKKNYVINRAELIFAEALGNNIILHLANRNDIKLYTNLTAFCEKLGDGFLRCHKSYAVNMEHIAEYEPYEFLLKSGQALPIPPKKYKLLTAKYEEFLNNKRRK